MTRKRWISWLIAPVLAILFCLTSFGLQAAASGNQVASERVFDKAGLFTEEVKRELEDKAERFIKETGLDMAILTVSSTEGVDTREYADSFYTQTGLGTGKNEDGVLCVLDMDNQEYYIYTYGIMIRYLTDKRIEEILGAAYPYMKSQQYGDAAIVMLDSVATDVDEGIEAGQYNYDPVTGKRASYHNRSITWYEFLFALAGASILAALPCMSIARQYRMEKEHRQAQNYYKAYRGNCNFAFQLKDDQFLNRTVTRRYIQSPSGPSGNSGGSGSSAGRSTVHHSGGRTHGGGGRKF